MKKREKTYVFMGKEVRIRYEKYAVNGTLAVRLESVMDDEYMAVVTVNLDCPLQGKKRAFVDENNVPGIGEWLVANGIARALGYRQESGFCVYGLYEFK